MSKYNVTGFPWSSGIGTSVKGCTTVREVMEMSKLDFEVKKCELVAKMPFSINGNNKISEVMGDFARDGNIYRECPSAYATYRTDKNIPLGVVKSKYEVIQNMDAFNFFDEVIGPDKAEYQYAGYFGHGHKIFVCAKLAISTEVKGDPIDHYLVFSNSHDGSSSLDIMFTPVRVFCTNCLNSALHNSDSYIRLRHTQSIKNRLDIGTQVLKTAFNYAETSKELYECLALAKMSDEEVLRYISNLALSESEQIALNDFDSKNGYKKLYSHDYLTMEKTGISTRKINQIVGTYEYYLDGIGQQQIAGTAWGAYNAVTGFYSNVANLEGEKRMNSILYGTANTAMQKALVSAYEIAKAA